MRLLVPLLLVALVGLPSVTAASEGPHLLVRIENLGPAISVEILVEEMATDRVIAQRIVDLPANDLTQARFDVDPSEYFVAITADDPSADPIQRALGERGGVALGADMSGCPGATSADFRITASGLGTVDSGCLVLTADAETLLAEARAARTGISRSGFEIPAPGNADRGVFGGELFEWHAEAEFLDAWGAPARGVELRYQSSGYSMTGSRDRTGARAIEAEVSEPVESLYFREGERAPHAWTTTQAGFGTEQSATSTSVTVERELRYDNTGRTLACALRNGLQGRALRAGDVVAAADVCPRWSGPHWRAAVPIEIEGHRLLPLYQLEESEERILVARVLILDGIPYPVGMERYVLPAGLPLQATVRALERYQAGGDPIALDGILPADPAVRLAALDPLRGPALGDSGARVRFPLAEASDAARADPTLRDLQMLLARPDAALVGAIYGTARDEGSPLVMLRWQLLFAASEAPPVAVVCERPDSPLPIPPPARCSAPPPIEPMSFPGFPSIGRDALPARSATFAQAIARWDAVRGGAHEDAITAAAYIGWEEDRAPFLAVGSGVPSALSPVGTDGSGAADHVALDLVSARTLAQVKVVQAGETLGSAPLARVGPTTLRVTDAPLGDASALPLLVGVGVGLALLALLGFLLYSRLVRSRVLDDATRAAIHDVVAKEPGLHASAILQELGKSSGVGEYHLDVLVREGYLTSVATPGFRRYYITGRHTPGEMRALAALREGKNEKLMHIIRANPGIELRMLAAEAGVSVPYVSRSVQRLADAGLVEKVQVGRAIAVHAVEA